MYNAMLISAGNYIPSPSHWHFLLFTHHLLGFSLVCVFFLFFFCLHVADPSIILSDKVTGDLQIPY